MSLGGAEAAVIARSRPSRSRRRPDPLFALGVAIVATAVILALVGPGSRPPTPPRPPFFNEAPPPLADWPGVLLAILTGDLPPPPHWFGADASGVDVFSRVIAAPRTGLAIALAANVLSLVEAARAMGSTE